MNANYFYERLINYENERMESGKSFYGYCNGGVSIHQINNKSEYFIIHKDKSIIKVDDNGTMIDVGMIDDLIGDDYELFSSVQVIKSGYLAFQKGSEYPSDIRVVISNLYHRIESFSDPSHVIRNNSIIPTLCGGSCWKNGLTDHFSYYDPTGIEVQVRTVQNLCKENVDRKYYDARVLPFIKSMDSRRGIHISFVYLMYRDNKKGINKKCEEAIKNLLTYVNNRDIEWVECRSKYPIYL